MLAICGIFRGMIEVQYALDGCCAGQCLYVGERGLAKDIPTCRSRSVWYDEDMTVQGCERQPLVFFNACVLNCFSEISTLRNHLSSKDNFLVLEFTCELLRVWPEAARPFAPLPLLCLAKRCFTTSSSSPSTQHHNSTIAWSSSTDQLAIT